MSFFTPEKVLSNSLSNSKTLTFYGSDHQISRRYCSKELIGSERSPHRLFKNNVTSNCDRIMNGQFGPSECDRAENREVLPHSSKLHRKNHRHYKETEDSDRPIKSSSSSNKYGITPDHFSGNESRRHSEKRDDQDARPGIRSRETLKLSRRYENKTNPTQSNSCECQIHSRKHKNCCSCSEPYHQTVCNCAQHGESHGYCCRCDPELLKGYDLYLNKKRYLNLLPDKGDSQLNDSSSETGPDLDTIEIPESKKCDSLDKKQVISCDDSIIGRRLLPLLAAEHSGKFDFGDMPAGECEPNPTKIVCRECSHSSQDLEDGPCSVCCQKLNTIHDKAVQEIYNMLVAISKSLQPTTHCCLLENLIKELKPQEHCGEYLHCCDCSTSSIEKSVGSNQSVSTCIDPSPTRAHILSTPCDVAVQVDSYNDETVEDPVEAKEIKPKRSLKKKLKSSCTIS